MLELLCTARTSMYTGRLIASSATTLLDSATAARQLHGSAACDRPSSPPLWLSFMEAAAAAAAALDQLCANLQPLHNRQCRHTKGSGVASVNLYSTTAKPSNSCDAHKQTWAQLLPPVMYCLVVLLQVCAVLFQL